MRRHIYMATKMGLGGNPYGVLREPLKKELIEVLLKKLAEIMQKNPTVITQKKQPAIIKKIKPEKDLDDHEGVWVATELLIPHEEMRPHPPQPKLWYLIAVLKKTGISLDQVGDNNGLTFLGNVIHQFKLLNPGACNYVCFLYNYFQKVTTRDWPAKNAILEKLTKCLPKMEQTRNKAKKSFNKWWREEMLKQIIYYRYQVFPPRLNRSCLRCSFTPTVSVV